MEAKIGVMWPQAKECLESPKLQEVRKDAPLQPPERAGPR